MTGEEYSNLKQGDRVIVTTSNIRYLREKGTIYEVVYRDHYKEAIYIQSVQTEGLGDIKIVDPAIAIRFLDIYKDNMEKKELKIQVDFNVGDEFWVMKDNRPTARKVDRISIDVTKDGMSVIYVSGITSYSALKIFHTKQELFDSL